MLEDSNSNHLSSDFRDDEEFDYENDYDGNCSNYENFALADDDIEENLHNEMLTDNVSTSI